ncbi:hypothetical protein [Pelotomaculum propionicicum]|uniref:Uncharacterized protein n=1 Tax=Pelotomaculum propionicicum TaxID=258475 RepID=A0A4Y7RIR6_9FIRM|nr:hypothetical protein [Pelotomaculum propionicicum]NLI11271.1 hypothetical protein [Peptococcaceae bacterium]TEB08885.1 hypothetical protein Pmgp_03557 [Pelotomaculum propionicicum]
MRLKMTQLVVLLVLVLIAVGCAGRTEKSKNIENREQNGLPSIVEKSPGVPEIGGLAPGDMPLCCSPDLKTVYVMNYADPEPEFGVIIGDYTIPVDLYRLDNGQRTKVASGIPFITLARWSPDGKYLGIAGGRQLHVLNFEDNSLDSVNNLVNIPSAVFFGWSPDSKTVYVENKNVVNGAVFNVESHEGLPSYRIKERFPFFKAKLSDNLFLGTVMSDLSTSETVIMDGEGHAQKSVGRGKFRDLAGNSILQVGKGDFGLAFYADVNAPEGVLLTDKFIYQCQFLPQGGIIYTTPGETGAKLSYDLTVVTQKEQKTVKVSGPYFNVWPDGRFVDVCGCRAERLDLPELAVVHQQDRHLYEEEKDKIIACARGAISAYIEYYHRFSNLDDQALKQELSRYYADTREPVEQVALTDIYEELRNRPSAPYLRADERHLTGQIKFMEIHDNDRATLVAGFLSTWQMFVPSGDNDRGVLPNPSAVSGSSFETAYEMIKLDGSWYVTGLSTFPRSRERQEIAELVDDFIAYSQSNGPAPVQDEQSRQFYEQIRGKEVRAGQIQFWNMSDPYRSPNAEQSNFALVYLYAGEARYKLVFSREQDWRIESIHDSSHPGLF